VRTDALLGAAFVGLITYLVISGRIRLEPVNLREIATLLAQALAADGSNRPALEPEILEARAAELAQRVIAKARAR
jgi:hypothetical protein